MSRFLRLIPLVACAWLVLLPATAQPRPEGSAPVVRTELRRDMARITFEWPQTVYFTADAQGKQLSIRFERRLKSDVSVLAQALSPVVTSAKIQPDGKTVRLTLNKPYKVRTFISDHIGGVELLGVDTAQISPTRAPKAEPKPAPALAQKQPKAPPEPESNSKKLTPLIAQAQAKTLATLAPAAGEAVAAPAPAAAPASQPASAPPSAQNAVEETPPPAMPPLPAATAAKPLGDAEAIAQGAGRQQAENPNVLKVNLSAEPDSAVLRLPFSQRVALAVFVRARSLWVVASTPLPVDLSDFDTMPQTVIGKAEQMAAKGAIVLRMPVDDGVYVHVAKEENNLGWAVLLTSKKKPLTTALKPAINTDPPAPAHLFIPALEMADPVSLIDPQVGEEILAIPLYKTSEGVAALRDFVEFTLLETAQGVAVAKKSDDVAVVQLRSGLRVALPQGATLTPGLPEAEVSETSASLALGTLFPYEQWRPESDDPFKIRKEIRELRRKIVDAPNLLEANAARLRLAKLYLSLNMAPEAIALMDGINRTNPSFYRTNKVNALRGAANFLMYRFTDAARDFAASELNNNKEIDYWRAMLGDLLGSGEQPYDYMAMNADYISKYSPLLRQRLAIVAADRNIASKEYNTALQIFDDLNNAKLLEPVQHYVNFLMAKIASETGQSEEANASLDKLAQDEAHPFVAARAEYLRIVWGMDNDTLSKEQVTDRLERLRLRWHGDSLELSILTLLGDLYFQRKDYVNAMRVWNSGVIGFPNSSAAVDMARKMQEVFITVFNEGVADSLPPLEALALYYEYRNYTPSGNTGNAITERLADRLVDVDLLDQAALLLDHHMRNQIEKDQRSRVGTKLASIYLLNRQPQKALQALQESVYGENPLVLRLARNRVTAEAMAQLGQSDKAMATLGEDNSDDAERIRINIYWNERDWESLTKSLEKKFKLRADNTAPISVQESEYLLKLALAYVFQSDKVQLQYLRDYFGPLMAKNPNRDMFDFITGGEMTLTTNNFEEVVTKLSNTRNFLQSYDARKAAVANAIN